MRQALPGSNTSRLDANRTVLDARPSLLARNAYLAMLGSNLLERASYVAHAMHCGLDVNRHALAAALSFLAAGMLALDACNFSLGNWNTPWDCPDAGPAPPNSRTTANEAGCKFWSCDPGFFACGYNAPCAENLLGDPHNCGACGNDCGGGICLEGTCALTVVLVDGIDSHAPIASDGASIYAFNGTASALLRIPRGGGAPTKIASLDPHWNGGFNGIAADSSGVYWTWGGALYALPTDAPQPTTLVDDLYTPLNPLLLDAGWVYFIQMVLPPSGEAGSIYMAVSRVAKTGGTPELVFPLLLLQGSGFDSPMVLNSGRLAFADGTKLYAVNADGGFATQLDIQPFGFASLAADDTHIYFTRGSSIVAPAVGCFLDGAACPTPVVPDDAAAAQGAFAIPWDGGSLRAVSKAGGLVDMRVGHGALWGIGNFGAENPTSIVRIDLTTGAATIFAGGGQIGAVAVDADGVYWARDGKLLFSPQK